LVVHIVRLLFIQQPGNTHGIYRSGQDHADTPSSARTLLVSPRLLKLTRVDSRRIQSARWLDASSKRPQNWSR
jgi:hypothetical protein